MALLHLGRIAPRGPVAGTQGAALVEHASAIGRRQRDDGPREAVVPDQTVLKVVVDGEADEDA
jgi:hypothetical protein